MSMDDIDHVREAWDAMTDHCRELVQQVAAKDALLRHAKEALERAIEQMHFTEPWSAAEEDIAFAIEASTAIDKELK